MSCDLNPCPVSSGSGFDYSQIQKSIARNLGIESTPAPSTRGRPSTTTALLTATATVEQARQASRAALSRSNSVIERSSGYTGRSSRASSVSRTSSFADRSYGTRTSLARQCSFSIADYSSAVRRSSVFDGYAGYSIYSSISEGLDQITYGGRTSRRNSITEMSYSFSRRGSVSGGGGGAGGVPDYPLPALMAALDATKASQEERAERKLSATAVANAHINGQASAYYSRQSSTNDNSAIESPFGAVLPGSNSRHSQNYAQPAAVADMTTSHETKALMRRKSSIKHSQSGQRLERKVSFHSQEVTQSASTQDIIQLDENGEPMVVAKPRRKKERTEEEKAARKERKERKERKRMDRELSKDRRVVPAGELLLDEGQQLVRNKLHPVGGDLVQQVSAKLLQQLGEEEQLQQQQELTPLPPSSLFPSSMEPKPKLRQQASSREPIKEG